MRDGEILRTVDSPPRASVLIESMRDIGYSLETALADIVDNSITAGAKDIRIFARISEGEGSIAIADDGEGMTEEALLEAMRPGSRSPREERAPNDLGRFGLGMKTASFSQCRRLTVTTRSSGTTSAARWDLDTVAETDEWLVQIPDEADDLPWTEHLPPRGTLIVWDKLDRLLERDAPDGGHAHFIRRVDEARSHLELVFHRFLSARGANRVRILLNERPLEPLDPFNSEHSATIRGPVETIKVGDALIEVQTFTLPHHSKVSSEEWERTGGADGYLRNQGFYVYRGKRLIVHGTWFGLARQMELTKLARVRIDIPNELDVEWKIDVKKASAQPPFPVRERLRRIIETIGATSRRVYTTRGRKLVSDDRLPVWNRIQDQGGITYRVNADHPVLVDFRTRLPTDLQNDFIRVLEFAGAGLPMDALFADLGGAPEQVAGNQLDDATLLHAVITARTQLLSAGVDETEAVEMLRVAEPFRSNFSRVESILDEIGN